VPTGRKYSVYVAQILCIATVINFIIREGYYFFIVFFFGLGSWFLALYSLIIFLHHSPQLDFREYKFLGGTGSGERHI
jgi:hypothetical protein